MIKRREFAHNPTGTKVSSNTSKNLDAKLEIKTGKFGNVGATGKKKFCSELKERKKKEMVHLTYDELFYTMLCIFAQSFT